LTKKRSIQAIWLKNQSPEEQAAIRHTLETNTAFIDHLLELLEEFSQEEENATKGLKDYESPSWPYLRSNRDGALRAYSKIKQLFKSIES
jgi:hypothetical protein